MRTNDDNIIYPKMMTFLTQTSICHKYWLAKHNMFFGTKSYLMDDQQCLIKLLGYKFEIKFKVGADNHTIDALSHVLLLT